MRAWRKKQANVVAHVDAFSFAPPPFAAPAAPPAPVAPPAAPPARETVTAPPVEARLVEIPAAAPTVNDPIPETVPVAASATVDPLAMQSEFLRLLAVVTSMCDHVIEYIEADRTERRAMIETLRELSRVIGDRATADGTEPAAVVEIPTGPGAIREHVIGGSMPAGPETIVDLRNTEPDFNPDSDRLLALVADLPLEVEPDIPLAVETPTEVGTEAEIEVEVRGRFGDRWVDGFEICEVLTTPDGLRYRLRRHRDGVVLPELFDATSIRHIETFEQLRSDQINGSQGYWSRS